MGVERVEDAAPADAVALALVRTDPDGALAGVTGPWTAIMGVAPADAAGDGWLDAVDPRDRRATARAWDAGIAAGRGFSVRFRVGRPDGRVVWAEVRMSPERPGAPASPWAGVVADVTAQVREQTETAARERIATAVAQGHDPRLVFHLVAREAAAVAGCESGGVVRLEEGDGVLVGTWAAEGLPTAHLGTAVSLGGHTATSLALLEGRARRVSYPTSLSSGPEFLRANPYRAGAAAPISVRGEVWGALSVATVWESRLPPDVEEELERFAGLVALSIANADSRSSLRALAESDHLTGLPNPRAFHERLATEARAWRPGARPLGLVLIDVDGFKRINDRHGHQAGDRVLAEVARRLGESVRLGEMVARVGGEEFAWIGSVDEASAASAAERLRRAVACRAIPPAGTVTVSCGVAAMEEGLDARELYRRADHALYAAKSAGRDRVERHSAAADAARPARRAAEDGTRAAALAERIVLAWSVSPGDQLVVDVSGMGASDPAAREALRAAVAEIEGAGGRVRLRRTHVNGSG